MTPHDSQGPRHTRRNVDAIAEGAREQIRRAHAARHEYVKLALSVAEVEEQVAEVMDWVAATGAPELAERRHAIAQQARDYASLERARAGGAQMPNPDMRTPASSPIREAGHCQ